jgi:hypothetical protein
MFCSLIRTARLGSFKLSASILIASLVFLLFSSDTLAQSAPRGAARRWEGALPVGPWSQVNLRTGRVLTTIPVVSWSGRGPSISFSLYHNMTSTWGPIGSLPGDLDGITLTSKHQWKAHFDKLFSDQPNIRQLGWIADAERIRKKSNSSRSASVNLIPDPWRPPDGSTVSSMVHKTSIIQ